MPQRPLSGRRLGSGDQTQTRVSASAGSLAGTPSRASFWPSISRINRRILLICTLLVAFAWAQSDRLFWEASLMPKLLVFRALLFLVALDLALEVRRGTRLPRVPLALAGAFLLWSLISTVGGSAPRVSLLGEAYRYEGFIALAGYFLVFFFGWLWGRRSSLQAVRAGSLVLAVTAGAIGLLAIFQQVSPDPDSPFAASGAVRSWGTFGNPLYLALFGCLFLPLLGVLAAIKENGALTRVLCAVAGAFLLAGIVASDSRAALLALPLSCLAVASTFPQARSRRRLVAAGGGVVVAVGLIGLIALGLGGTADRAVGGRIAELWSGEGTVGTRVEMYKGALELIGEQPLLGWGLGTYGAEAVRVRTERLVAIEGANSYPDRPHSSLLYLAYATGLPGALLYMLFLIVGLLMLMRGIRSQRGAGRLIAAGGIAGVFAYLLAELTVFSTIEVTPLMFLLFGWLIGFSSTTDGGDEQMAGGFGVERDEYPGRSWGSERLVRGAVFLLPLFFLTGAAHAATVALADASYNRVVEGTGTEDRLAAAKRARLASRLDPYVAEYWNIRATLYAQAAEELDEPALLIESEAVLKEGLRRLPDHPLLVVSLADVLLRQGNYEQAVLVSERHLTRNRFSGDANFNLALALIGLYEYQRAAAALERAIAINPGDAEALMRLADVYQELGQEKAASRARERALMLDPNLKGGGG